MVKIGNKIFDSREEPILLILSEEEKGHIANMSPDAHQYCQFPDTADPEKIREWMNKSALDA